MPIDCDFRIFVDRLQATVSLRPGEFLFREGDAADALYIVSRGTLRIMSGIAVYEVVEAGGIVGEMAIAEEDKPRSEHHLLMS
jgi:CRP-like cAMP-binding protein